MSEEARKAAENVAVKRIVNRIADKSACGKLDCLGDMADAARSGWNAHAEHTAAIREKAMALVERIAEIEEYDHVEYPELVDELTALKAALEETNDK